MDNLTWSLMSVGQLEEAEALSRQAFQAKERLLGNDHIETFLSLDNLSDVLVGREKLDEAGQLRRQRLAAFQRLRGPDDPDTRTSQISLGILLQRQGKRDEAGQLLQPAVASSRQAVADGRRKLGPEDPKTLVGQSELAWLLDNQGNAQEAKALYRATLEAQRRVCGRRHDGTHITQVNLAVLLAEQGQKAEAEALCGEPLEIRRVPGADHPPTVFDGAWRGKWENSGGQIGEDSLSIKEAGGTITGVWSGYVRFRGERLGRNTFVIKGITATRWYGGVGAVDNGKLLLHYTACHLNTGGTLYRGSCVFTKSNWVALRPAGRLASRSDPVFVSATVAPLRNTD
jgi:tetratricopeptide (TPR) repeat protein